MIIEILFMLIGFICGIIWGWIIWNKSGEKENKNNDK